MNINTINGLFSDAFFVIRSYLSSKHKRVNSDLCTSGIGLHCRSHETLWEEHC